MDTSGQAAPVWGQRLDRDRVLERGRNGSDLAEHDLAAVVQRLAESSLARGANGGTVRMWRQRHAVVCEVADDAPVSDQLVGRARPKGGDHDALWFANQTCDLVQLRSSTSGTAVRIHRWL